MLKTRWEQIHRFFRINPKGSKRLHDTTRDLENTRGVCAGE